MGTASEVLGPWPVQLGLVIAMAVVGCWVFDLALRLFTGSLRLPVRRVRRPRRPSGDRTGARVGRATGGAQLPSPRRGHLR